ncbi:DUF2231 domain-containing protein [Nitrosophilus labii]|uniref:DUF2231 domain-containing protein n=1 Tax=Nitrosophilus labii TaxID=2706014 RepID=UPI001656D114|nr:DUF2231 domain-containing protein [Nitrosophilus labii]
MEFLNFLDTIKLPFELPILLHPVTVHFAITLPIIILILEIVNLFIKRPYLNIITSSFLFFVIFIFTAAFFAGKADGSHAFSLLSPEGQEELKLHKTIGMYLVYATVFVFLLKLLSMAIKKDAAQAVYMVALLVFIGITLKQGKDGGELVYEYGANVEAISKMDDKIMELEDKIDELETKLKECSPAKEESQQSTAQEVNSQPTKTETVEQQESNATLTVQSENIDQNATTDNNTTH